MTHALMIHAGRYSNAEKDRIESEVGLVVKACTQQIEQLKASVQAADSSNRLSPQAAAHCYGVVSSWQCAAPLAPAAVQAVPILSPTGAALHERSVNGMHCYQVLTLPDM